MKSAPRRSRRLCAAYRHAFAPAIDKSTKPAESYAEHGVYRQRLVIENIVLAGHILIATAS
ncbi:hypothetical protein M5585_26770 [Serratia ureilytica]